MSQSAAGCAGLRFPLRVARSCLLKEESESPSESTFRPHFLLVCVRVYQQSCLCLCACVCVCEACDAAPRARVSVARRYGW